MKVFIKVWRRWHALGKSGGACHGRSRIVNHLLDRPSPAVHSRCRLDVKKLDAHGPRNSGRSTQQLGPRVISRRCTAHSIGQSLLKDAANFGCYRYFNPHAQARYRVELASNTLAARAVGEIEKVIRVKVRCACGAPSRAAVLKMRATWEDGMVMTVPALVMGALRYQWLQAAALGHGPRVENGARPALRPRFEGCVVGRIGCVVVESRSSVFCNADPSPID